MPSGHPAPPPLFVCLPSRPVPRALVQHRCSARCWWWPAGEPVSRHHALSCLAPAARPTARQPVLSSRFPQGRSSWGLSGQGGKIQRRSSRVLSGQGAAADVSPASSRGLRDQAQQQRGLLVVKNCCLLPTCYKVQIRG